MLSRLHETLMARVDAGRLPGAVAAADDGDQAWVDMVGVTEFGGTVPMRRDTPFRIASLTKPMLAAVTMTLVEDGQLALDEPVDRLLPELADRRVLVRPDAALADTVPAERPITVADLLTSRLGHGIIVEPEFNPPYPVVRAAEELQLTLAQPDPRTPHPPDEWIRRFATLPLLSQPGTRWHYNTAYLVLGVLVARAAGQALGEVCRKRLFEPLGMASTGFWLPAAQATRLPGYYLGDFAGGAPARQPVSGPEEWAAPPVFPSGTGGLASTVDDVLAFARMLRDGGRHGTVRLLSTESVRAMTTNHLTDAQIAGGGMLLEGNGWGYGMSVTVAPDDISAVPGRYGWSGGYGTVWYTDPASGRIAVLLTQVADVLFDGTATQVVGHAMRS